MEKNISEKESLSVGGLLYSPALHPSIAQKIIRHDIPYLTSIALCLEDSIRDDAIEEAENWLVKTLCCLRDECSSSDALPSVFVRIRTPEHLMHVHQLLGDLEEELTGYIFPKFDSTNSEEYLLNMQRIRAESDKSLVIMPILESEVVANLSSRLVELERIRQSLDDVHEMVLNVRVGGNDFSNVFGIRRGNFQTIYDCGVVRDILLTIINVFSREYVVSGPVWEYFGEDPNGQWAVGLQRELELDRLNGFVGKTAIHPSQLPLIYKSLMVTQSDYEDALSILEWNDTQLGVSKGSGRMNEVKCHTRWARRIKALADLFGIQEEKNDSRLV